MSTTQPATLLADTMEARNLRACAADTYIGIPTSPNVTVIDYRRKAGERNALGQNDHRRGRAGSYRTVQCRNGMGTRSYRQDHRPMTARKPIHVVVVQRAYAEFPDMVIRPRIRETDQDAILRHYPTATFDLSGFDTADGGSFIYATMHTTD